MVSAELYLLILFTIKDFVFTSKENDNDYIDIVVIRYNTIQKQRRFAKAK